MLEYDKAKFGSPLNFFISEYCRKDMVVCNIDLIIDDYINKVFTIIESKHDHERLRKGQGYILKRLREIMPKEAAGYIVQVLIVRGNYPYYSAELQNVNGDTIRILDQKGLVDFLNNDHLKLSERHFK